MFGRKTIIQKLDNESGFEEPRTIKPKNAAEKEHLELWKMLQDESAWELIEDKSYWIKHKKTGNIIYARCPPKDLEWSWVNGNDVLSPPTLPKKLCDLEIIKLKVCHIHSKLYIIQFRERVIREKEEIQRLNQVQKTGMKVNQVRKKAIIKKKPMNKTYTAGTELLVEELLSIASSKQFENLGNFLRNLELDDMKNSKEIGNDIVKFSRTMAKLEEKMKNND